MHFANDPWIRKLSAAALSLGLAVPAFAVDNATKTEVTSDRSKNPITGTVTDTKKYKKHRHNAHGQKEDVDVTEKVKTKTDGTVEKTIDSDVSTTPAK